MSENSQKSLDVGCGQNKLDGAVGIDIADLDEVDVVHDLEETPWPLPDNESDFIRAQDVIEHLSNPVAAMEELFRVAAPDASIIVWVPYYNSKYAWGDPTHEKAFSNKFPNYFVANGEYDYYSDADFRVVDAQFDCSPLGRLVPTDKLTLKMSFYIQNLIRTLTFKFKPIK